VLCQFLKRWLGRSLAVASHAGAPHLVASLFSFLNGHTPKEVQHLAASQSAGPLVSAWLARLPSPWPWLPKLYKWLVSDYSHFRNQRLNVAASHAIASQIVASHFHR